MMGRQNHHRGGGGDYLMAALLSMSQYAVKRASVAFNSNRDL